MNHSRIGSLIGVLLVCGCQAPTPDQARLGQPVFQAQSARTAPHRSLVTVFIVAGLPPR